MRRTAGPSLLIFLAFASPTSDSKAAEANLPLQLERTISLGNVSGRIDHMAVDLTRRRLLVAELGNNSVDVVDLDSGQVLHRITGLHQPQGIAFAPGPDLVIVANAGDGSTRFYGGGDFTEAGRIDLGEDADNVRIDLRTGHAVVGYGSGGLAVIDLSSRVKTGAVALPAHPEGFQIAPDGARAFVNVPDAGQVAVVDLLAGRQTTAWVVSDLRSNFPMAIDATGQLLLVVFRHPARLVLIDTGTGKPAAQAETCGDADDVFLDAKRSRVYVSCGAGSVDVFAQQGAEVRRIARIDTASGARTALFVPELDRLFVAARAGLLGGEAKILVFRPSP